MNLLHSVNRPRNPPPALYGRLARRWEVRYRMWLKTVKGKAYVAKKLAQAIYMMNAQESMAQNDVLRFALKPAMGVA